MPVDNEVAKERIWKEHCDKLIVQSLKSRSDGLEAGFTINPYRLQQNKPVTGPVSYRQPRFLDRHKAALETLGSRLTSTGLSPNKPGDAGEGSSEASPRNVSKRNKDKAVEGNHIFGNNAVSAESRRKLLDDWTTLLNNELGGGDSLQCGHFDISLNGKHHTTTLPPLSPQALASPTKQQPSTHGNSLRSPTSEQQSPASHTKVQELLIRSSMPPVDKYKKPVTESQVLGWEARNAPAVETMFNFPHKQCEMTRFASESGHSPTKGR